MERMMKLQEVILPAMADIHLYETFEL